MKTIEGIEFWSFVSKPAEISENPRFCNGMTVKEWIDNQYSGGYHSSIVSLQKEGCARAGGWCFDLKPWLKKYIYTFYGSIYSAYAPSVKALRKSLALRRVEHVALAPEGF